MNQHKPNPIVLHGGRGARVPLHAGSLQQLPQLLQDLGPHWVILVDQGIPLHQQVRRDLAKAGYIAISWRGGESCKTRKGKAELEDLLLDLPLDPTWGICAVGGGALLDLAGYTASNLLRGLRLVLVPTTLLAMVDASVGSKNGINHPRGKNLLGTLYDPLAIWLDLELIHQMPKPLLRQGAAEMIKHAIIGARGQLTEMTQIGNTLCGDSPRRTRKTVEKARDALAGLVVESIRVKDRVVERSYKDPEWRHLLNAGHTVAHGWEAASGYALSHGDAVGAGLWVESQLACDLGDLHPCTVELLADALRAWQFGIPPQPWESVVPFLLRDKKNEDGRMLLALVSETSTRALPSDQDVFRRTEVHLNHLQKVYQRCQPVPA